METRAGRGTSLLSDVKTMLNSSSCYAPYSPLTLGAPIIPRCHKESRICVYQQKPDAKVGTASALQGRFHVSTSPSRQQSPCRTAQGFEDRARFETPSRMTSPSALIRGHGKTGNERKPVSASACIQSGCLAIQAPFACFGEGANQRDQTVMYNVFSDTFAYLIGAISCLRFSQLRKDPWGPQTAS